MKGITFGGYCHTPITEIGKRMEDNSSFLFTFKDNKPKTFEIIQETEGIKINSSDDKELFSFGTTDIQVLKLKQSSRTSGGSCKQNPKYYNYKGEKSALNGTVSFQIKSLHVFQMIESTEDDYDEYDLEEENKKIAMEEIQRKNQLENEMIHVTNDLTRKEEYLKKQTKERKIELTTKKTKEENELKLLKQQSIEMKLSIPPIIEEIEEQTQVKMKEILFDSNFCDWGKKSLFGERVINKDKL